MEENQVFIQKLGSHKRVLQIKSDHVLVYNKTMHEDLEYRVKFEDIGFEKARKRNKTANIPFYFFIAFSTLNAYLLIDSLLGKEYAMAVFWLVGFLFFGGLTIYSFSQRNKDIIYLTGGQQALEMMANRPSEVAVEQFIAQLHHEMRGFYKERYYQLPAEIALEVKIAHLNWLRSIEAVTKAEHQSLLEEAQAKTQIGFLWQRQQPGAN